MNDDKPLFDSGIDADKAFGVVFGRNDNLNVFCPWCEEEGTSRSPSCSVSSTGAFNCKSCKRHGFAIDFYMKTHRLTKQAALAQLESNGATRKAKESAKATPAAPKISNQMVERLHSALMRSSFELKWFADRGIEQETLRTYELGLDEQRITFPVRDERGNLVQIRRYLIGATTQPKIISHRGGDGGPHWYPHPPTAAEAAEAPYIVLNEGECDTLLARQDGLIAYTITSGVATWQDQFTEDLLSTGKMVVLIYDVNDSDADLGQRIARERANLLVEAGIEVKVVRLPLPSTYVGGDYTDWRIEEKHPAKSVLQMIDEAPTWEWTTDTIDIPSLSPQGDSDNIPLVTLHDAASGQYFFQNIKLRCLVAGKRMSPFLMPSKVTVDVTLEDGSVRSVERTFDPYDGIILNLINCSTTVQKKFLRTLFGVPAGAQMSILVQESVNVEELYLIPSVEMDGKQGPYTLRQCYYVGHGIETNRVYEFTGYTLPDPRTQAATHILTEAKLAETDIDHLELTDDDIEQMRSVFSTTDVHAKMEDIAEQMSQHITHIYGRDDLHTAVDLVFHSPLHFDFDGTRVRKGWLEALIIGDTRTGKGCVAEGLSRHYGVGEVISGENLSFAGLVGGIQSVDGNLILKWGKIPLADRRALVLDEAAGLPVSDMGKLSRIRSEGVAEVNKILTEKTSARTRLIWLSNPRPSIEGKPRMLSSFNFGIESVNELIGAVEDVARFDYVLTVAQNEVPSKLMNSQHRLRSKLIYTDDLCRKLVVWAWSRTPDQIRIPQATVQYVLKAAQSLGAYFSPSVCLIQSEDVRFKLARIACAVAARTFSTEDGVNLLVTIDHVQFAYNFLHHIYSKASCGYGQLSLAEREGATLRDPEAIRQSLESAGDAFDDLIAGLLEHRLITARDLCDYSGLDIIQARMIISDLVRQRALTKDYNGYIKKPAFKTFLHKLRSERFEDPHTTEE